MFKQINSDMLEGAIRNPNQQEEIVGRALRGSVCSLPSVLMGHQWAPLIRWNLVIVEMF